MGPTSEKKKVQLIEVVTKDPTKHGAIEKIFKFKVITNEQVEDAVRLMLECTLTNEEFLNFGKVKKFLTIAYVNDGFISLHCAHTVKPGDTADSIMENLLAEIMTYKKPGSGEIDTILNFFELQVWNMDSYAGKTIKLQKF